VCEVELPGPKEERAGDGARARGYGCGRGGRCAPCRSGRPMAGSWGPGVLDIEAASCSSSSPCGRCANWRFQWAARVVLQLNSDEEVGSESSRAFDGKERRAQQGGAGSRAGHGAGGQAQNGAQGRGRFLPFEYADGPRTRAWTFRRAPARWWNWRGRSAASPGSSTWSAASPSIRG